MTEVAAVGAAVVGLFLLAMAVGAAGAIDEPFTDGLPLSRFWRAMLAAGLGAGLLAVAVVALA